MSSRVLKTGENVITFSYAEHCAKVDAGKGWARGVDVVKAPMNLDYIVAHSTGTIIKYVDYIKDHEADKDGNGYGNYVAILHDNNYVTIYAHMVNVSKLTIGNKIAKGTVLGYMGNTGNSFGGHLHFEVRKYNVTPNAENLQNLNCFKWLNPEPYLDADLPNDTPSPSIVAGQKVELNNTNCYNSESTPNPYGQKTGTYYLWDDVVKNGRIRITNKPERVGVAGQVTCWINIADVGLSASATTTISKPQLKSIDEIAKEVIKGKWGNGADRKNRLTQAGYDYNAVQARVNALLTN